MKAMFSLNAEEFLNLESDVHLFNTTNNDNTFAELIPGYHINNTEEADNSKNKAQISPEDSISFSIFFRFLLQQYPMFLTYI